MPLACPTAQADRRPLATAAIVWGAAAAGAIAFLLTLAVAGECSAALRDGAQDPGPLRAPFPGARGAPRDSSRRRPPIVPLAARAAESLGAAASRRVYIANDDHTDYMWALSDSGYRRALPQMLDAYMTQAETTAAYPPNRRGQFNCDGSVWVSEYEASRPRSQLGRLISHLRDGTITMPLNTLVQLYGAMPAEAVLRSFYYAGRLERRESLRFPLVVPMENQTLPGGVASLWAGCGAQYAWKGICNCATPIYAGDRTHDIYRFTGPDGQSVILKWNTLYGDNRSLGGYAEARDPYAAVGLIDTNPTFQARWPYAVAAAFGYGWDDPQSYTSAFLEAARDLTNSQREVIVSNEVDFFQDFEAQYGASLPSDGGSLGNDWDLLPASLGEVTARVRRSVEKLRSAEALACYAALLDPAFGQGLQTARDSATMACGLYYDHAWSAGPRVTEAQRTAWQRRIQQALAAYVDTLQARALARLAAGIRRPPGIERHLVFNPLSWRRSDFADLAVALPGPVHVVDPGSGIEVPSQAVVVDGAPRLRILASVPPVGYQVYEVRAGAGNSFSPSAAVTLPAFDNGLYRVTLGAHGQITSLLDHRDGDRELVMSGRGLNDLGSGNGSVALESAGPVSTTLRVTAGGSPAHETRVTLYAGVDRVDVENRITANFGDTQGYESSFNLSGAATHHEEVGMIARVARHAAGGDYADENTRTDYLTLNHFVDLSSGTRGVTMSSWDSQSFRAGNSTVGTLDATTPTVFAVVGMQLGQVPGGLQNQGGDTEFLNRFAYRTHGPWHPVSAMRMALEHQNPLVAAPVSGTPDAPLPPVADSLLAIDSPDVLLWALKPAEEGIQAGLIARVWNLADAPRSMALSLSGRSLAAAWQTTHVETDLNEVPVTDGVLAAMLERQQMRTWRLYPGDPNTSVPPTVHSAAPLAVFPSPARRGEACRIEFTLAAAGRARLSVYDLRGARIATPADGMLPAGRHAATWRVPRVAPGLYFLRLETATGAQTRRLVVRE